MKKISDLKDIEVSIRFNPDYGWDYGSCKDSINGNDGVCITDGTHYLNLSRNRVEWINRRPAYYHINHGFKTGLRYIDPDNGVVSQLVDEGSYHPLSVASVGVLPSDMYFGNTAKRGYGYDAPTEKGFKSRACLSKRELMVRGIANAFGLGEPSRSAWGTREYTQSNERENKYAQQVMEAKNLGILGFRHRQVTNTMGMMDAPTFLKNQFQQKVGALYLDTTCEPKRHLTEPRSRWDSSSEAGVPKDALFNHTHSPNSVQCHGYDTEDAQDVLRVASCDTYMVKLSKKDLYEYLNGFYGKVTSKPHGYKCDPHGRPIPVYDIEWVAAHQIGKGKHDKDVKVKREAEQDKRDHPDFTDPTKCMHLINRYIGDKWADKLLKDINSEGDLHPYHQSERDIRRMKSRREWRMRSEPELLTSLRSHRLISIIGITNGIVHKDGVVDYNDSQFQRTKNGDWNYVDVLSVSHQVPELEGEFFAVIRKYHYAGLARRVGNTELEYPNQGDGRRRGRRGMYKHLGKTYYLHSATHGLKDHSWQRDNSDLSYHNFNCSLLPVSEIKDKCADVSFLGSFLSLQREEAFAKLSHKFKSKKKVIHMGSMLGSYAEYRAYKVISPPLGKVAFPAYRCEDGIFYMYEYPVARLMYYRGKFVLFYLKCNRHFRNTGAEYIREFVKGISVRKRGKHHQVLICEVTDMYGNNGGVCTSDDPAEIKSWISDQLDRAITKAGEVARTHQRSVTNTHVWRYHRLACNAENLHRVTKLKKFQQRVDELRSVMRVAPMILKDKARGFQMPIFDDPTYGS